MYLRLYAAADLPVLIDDVDSLYRDRDAVRLLKCLCQTDPSKTISWNSDARTLVKKNIPSQFQTTSKVAIVANEWQQSNKDVLALEDRGHLIHFDPDAAEVHRKVAEWFWDQEVFDFLGERLQLIQQPSFRHYIAAAELKAGRTGMEGGCASPLPVRQAAGRRPAQGQHRVHDRRAPRTGLQRSWSRLPGNVLQSREEAAAAN